MLQTHGSTKAQAATPPQGPVRTEASPLGVASSVVGDRWTGRVLANRYRLQKQLGGGGVGQVYEGCDTQIDGRTVAIKILNLNRSPTAVERQQLKERFRREASAAAQINHPGVVTIHDMGETDSGEPFMVMERLEGHDLRVEVAKGPMAPRRALRLVSGALSALTQAHRQGVIHKDLKPANLFLCHPNTPGESLVLVDFGIAYIDRDGYDRLTRSGQMALTPNYAPPEYIGRQEVSSAFDVYQMGLILVELLMGRPVVNLHSAGLCIAAHAQGALAIPRSLMDGPLGPVVTKALALHPAERYPNAEAMAQALAAIHPDSVPAVSRRDSMVLLSAASFPASAFQGRGTSSEEACTTLNVIAPHTTLPPGSSEVSFEVEIHLPPSTAHPGEASSNSTPQTALSPSERLWRQLMAARATVGLVVLLLCPLTWLVLAARRVGRWHRAQCPDEPPKTVLHPHASEGQRTLASRLLADTQPAFVRHPTI
ncbi:MAG: serine/threonine-protein kinase [Myxococcota bacterium]